MGEIRENIITFMLNIFCAMSLPFLFNIIVLYYKFILFILFIVDDSYLHIMVSIMYRVNL